MPNTQILHFTKKTNLSLYYAAARVMKHSISHLTAVFAYGRNHSNNYNILQSYNSMYKFYLCELCDYRINLCHAIKYSAVSAETHKKIT